MVKTIIKYCRETHVVKIFLYTPPGRASAREGRRLSAANELWIFGFMDLRRSGRAARAAGPYARARFMDLLRRGLECHDTAAHVYGCNTLVT